MSHYATIAGHIQYTSTTALKKAVTTRQQGGWLTPSETWIDEDDTIRARTWYGQFRELVLKTAVKNIEAAIKR